MNTLQNKQYLLAGNGSDKVILSKGTKYASFFNPNPYNISLYRDSADLSNRIGYIPAYTNLSVPLPHLGTTEFPLLIVWAGTGTGQIIVFFSEEPLNINQSFAGPGSSSSVTIVGDSVGLAQAAQLPAALDGGNLKVSVKSTVGVTPSDLSFDGSGNLNVAIPNAMTVLIDDSTPVDVSISNTPNVGVDFSTLISAIQALFGCQTASNTSTGAALTVNLDTGSYGGRMNVEVFVQSSNTATFNVYGSVNGTDYRLVDTISITGAGSSHKGYNNAYRYIRVSTTAANDNTIEIAASR